MATADESPYVGRELELFASAINWKRYVKAEIGEYLIGPAATSWSCLRLTSGSSVNLIRASGMSAATTKGIYGRSCFRGGPRKNWRTSIPSAFFYRLQMPSRSARLCRRDCNSPYGIDSAC